MLLQTTLAGRVRPRLFDSLSISATGPRVFTALVALTVLTALSPARVLAQQPPDAGTLLQQQPPKPPAPAPVKPPVPSIEKPAAPAAETGPRVQVKAVRVQGNTLIPEAELAAQLQPLVGQELNFAQLEAAALALTGYYAQRGWLARVFLPQQDVSQGVVTYQVVEGARGALRIERQGERIDTDRVRRFIDARLPEGAPMDLAALGEALNILNEQPGATVKSALAPGGGERAIDLNVSAADRPLAGYSLGLNNQGSRGTGEWQLSAGASLANPTGRFDSASLLINAAEGSTYGRGDYSLAVGDRGLRLGVNASTLRYRLVQASFTALQARGTADTLGLTASYPLSRQGGANLDFTASYDEKELIDNTVAGQTGNRVVRVTNLGLSGYRLLAADSFGGVLTFGLTLGLGHADQRNAGALAADQASRRTQGGYAKLAGNLGWLRALDESWTFTGSLRGQLPNKNLDSSERFSLGGIGGVRAYPSAEATGDAGWLMSLALMRRLGERFSLGGFFDTGGVTINHTQPAGATARNRYGLSGAGLNALWQVADQATLSFTYAVPVGNNPGKDALGRNNDGSPANRPRAWISFAAQL